MDQALRYNFLLATLVLNCIALTSTVLVLSRLCYHYLRSLPGGCCGPEQEQVPFDDHMAKDAMRREETLKVRRAQKRRIIYLVALQSKCGLGVGSVCSVSHACFCLVVVACLFALPYSLSIIAW